MQDHPPISRATDMDKPNIFARSNMMKYLLFVVALLCAPLTHAEEMKDRREIFRAVHDLYLSENFAELETLANRFRTGGERTSSGLWKLTLFYFGFEATVNYRHSSQAFWADMRAKSDAYIRAYPRSPSAAIFQAIILRKYGWSIRGGGAARTVAPEDWAPFYQSLNAANGVLRQAQDFAAVDPEWYTQRSGILNELGVEPAEFEENVVEGLTAHPDYFQLYFESLRYYMPKWHGSAARIDAFANYAVSLTEETQGLGMYARIYWVAANAQYGNINLFAESSVDWPKMRQGMLDVVADYPDQWNIQTFAYFSCIKGDFETAGHFYDLINAEPIPQVWKPTELFTHCKMVVEANR